MANAQRGEVTLAAGSQTLTLRLTFNAICAMETRTGKTYGQLILGLSRLDFVATRELLFQALQAHHAKDYPTVASVGDLIETIRVSRAIDALTDLMKANAAKEDEGAVNPPAAQ